MQDQNQNTAALAAAVLAACCIINDLEHQQQTIASVQQMDPMIQAPYISFMLAHCDEQMPDMTPLVEWACALASEPNLAVQLQAISRIGVTICRVEPGLQEQLLSVVLKTVEDESAELQEVALEQLKLCAKKDAIVASTVPTIVSVVFPLTKVKSFVVKEAAKRCLMYLLQVHRRDEAAIKEVIN